METVYQVLGTALIIAIAIIVIALIFGDSIRKRIESGASFESSIGPGGAKLLLGPSEKEATTPPSVAQAPQASEAVLIDSKLIKLIPPLNPKRYKTKTLPLHQPPPVYKLPDAPTGVVMINQVPFYLQPVVDAARSLIGHQVIDLAPGSQNTATIEEVPAQVEEATAVHFLLSAGHGHVSWKGVQFLGKQVGRIELLFAENTTQLVPSYLTLWCEKPGIRPMTTCKEFVKRLSTERKPI